MLFTQGHSQFLVLWQASSFSLATHFCRCTTHICIKMIHYCCTKKLFFNVRFYVTRQIYLVWSNISTKRKLIVLISYSTILFSYLTEILKLSCHISYGSTDFIILLHVLQHLYVFRWYFNAALLLLLNIKVTYLHKI